MPALSVYSISQFNFADVFTDGKKLVDFSELKHIPIEVYENVSELIHRLALLAAVKTLITQFENQEPSNYKQCFLKIVCPAPELSGSAFGEGFQI